jgi:hypothetical protein
MSETIDQKIGQVHSLLTLTLRLGSDFAQAITTEAQADALLAAVESAYLSLGQNMNEATGLGCPGDWFQCDDGSCVEGMSDCKGGNESGASLEVSSADIGGEA